MSIRRMGQDVSIRMSVASANAASQLASQGMRLYPKPDVEVPRIKVGMDLTSLDDEGLMALYVQLTAWADYLSGQAACAGIDEKAADSQVELAEAKAFANNWGGKSADRIHSVKAQVSLDDGVVAAREEHARCYAYRKLVDVIAGNVERDSALVSREITRRTGSRSNTTSSFRRNA